MSSKSHTSAAAAAMNAANNNNKKRYVWPESLHKDFISAVFDVGLRVATVGELNNSLPELKGKISDRDYYALLQKLRVFRDRNIVPRPTYFELEKMGIKTTKSKKRSFGSSSSGAGGSVATQPSNGEGSEGEGGEESFDNENDTEVANEAVEVKREDGAGEGDEGMIDTIAEQLDNDKINANIVSIDQTLRLVHIQLQQMAHSIQYNHQLYYQLQKLIARQHDTFVTIVAKVKDIDPKLASFYQSALQPFFFHFAATSCGTNGYMSGFGVSDGSGNSTTGSQGFYSTSGVSGGGGGVDDSNVNDEDEDDDSSADSISMGLFGTGMTGGGSGKFGDLSNENVIGNCNTNDQEDANMLLDSLGGRKAAAPGTSVDGESPRKRSKSQHSSQQEQSQQQQPGHSVADEMAYHHQHHGGHQPATSNTTSEKATGENNNVGTGVPTQQPLSMSFNYSIDHSHQHHHIHTYSHSHKDSNHAHNHDHSHSASTTHTHSTANGAYTHSHTHSHDPNSDGHDHTHVISSSAGNGNTGTTGAGGNGKLSLSTSRTELNIMYEMRAQMDFHRLLLMKKENQLSQLGGIANAVGGSAVEQPTTSVTASGPASHLNHNNSTSGGGEVPGGGGVMSTSSSTSSMGALAAAAASGFSQGSNSNGSTSNAGSGPGPATALTHTNSLQSTGSNGSGSGQSQSHHVGDGLNMWDFELTTDLFSFLHDS